MVYKKYSTFFLLVRAKRREFSGMIHKNFSASSPKPLVFSKIPMDSRWERNVVLDGWDMTSLTRYGHYELL